MIVGRFTTGYRLAFSAAFLGPVVILSITADGLFARLVNTQHKGAAEDGAFMAELLTKAQQDLVVSQSYWEHHGRNDERFALGDPRRNWREGHVAEVGSQETVVVFPQEATASCDLEEGLEHVPRHTMRISTFQGRKSMRRTTRLTMMS